MNNRGSYWINLLKGLDYFGATIFGIPAGIYISAYVYMKDWVKCIYLINKLFGDPDHCHKAYVVNLDDIRRYYGSTDINR